MILNRTWRLRASIALTAMIAIVLLLGFSHGQTVKDGGAGMVLFLGPLYAAPFVVYFLMTRTVVRSLLIGSSLAITLVVGLRDAFASESSTAAVGLGLAPIYLAFIATMVCALDLVISTRWRAAMER